MDMEMKSYLRKFENILIQCKKEMKDLTHAIEAMNLMTIFDKCRELELIDQDEYTKQYAMLAMTVGIIKGKEEESK